MSIIPLFSSTNWNAVKAKIFAYHEIEQNLFEIDEELGRRKHNVRADRAMAANSSVAQHQQTGNHCNPSNHGSQNKPFHGRRPTRNTTLSAHATQNTNIVCFNCGEPGHIAPKCPKNKSKGQQSIKTLARGNSATGTNNTADSPNELICMALTIDYNAHPNLPRPRPRPIPVLETDFTGDEILNIERYVMLILPINRGDFHEFLEEHIRDGIIPTTYLGMISPTDDNLWIMLHDWPLAEQDRTFTAITCPSSIFDVLMYEAVVPALAMRFGPVTCPYVLTDGRIVSELT